ncbi:Protein of unknown function [Catalinimonas alkaloidigena]|uniref:DUF3109 family protein n=1 Tax=Catalinimonas alkaloidigena TaxID=1075417 RepID=A0A1G8WDX3_9BACT|nr:DUF3109 family protein [Catalinimonas alkaloidigena]SDJ76441.1 Protein of unknown function [Catalinimonas alkaloidigena]
MIIVDKAIVSDDVAEKVFVCHLEKCKGACCVEGDLGAPLEQDELEQLEEIYPTVAPYLSEAGRKAIEEQGVWLLDEEGDFSTPTIGGRECAYAIYDAKGTLKCGIEQAHRDGKIDFQKPISCHLYPIRITRYEEFDALNYDVWDICSPACELGAALNVPIYKFLKEPLIRKYGPAWYAKLVAQIEQVPTADDAGSTT